MDHAFEAPKASNGKQPGMATSHMATRQQCQLWWLQWCPKKDPWGLLAPQCILEFCHARFCFFYSFVAQPSWPLIQGNPFHHTIVNMFCLHHHLYHLFSLGAKSPCNAAFVATWLLYYSHHGHSDSAMFSFHVWQSWWPLFAKQCHIIHEICHQKFWPHLIALQVGFHCIHVAPFWPFRSLPQWES